MLAPEGIWPNTAEQTGSTLGLVWDSYHRHPTCAWYHTQTESPLFSSHSFPIWINTYDPNSELTPCSSWLPEPLLPDRGRQRLRRWQPSSCGENSLFFLSLSCSQDNWNLEAHFCVISSGEKSKQTRLAIAIIGLQVWPGRREIMSIAFVLL